MGPGGQGAEDRLAARSSQGAERPRAGEVVDLERVLHEAAERPGVVSVVDLVELGVQLGRPACPTRRGPGCRTFDERRILHVGQQFVVQAVGHDIVQRAVETRPPGPRVVRLDEGLVADRGVGQCPVAAGHGELTSPGPGAQVDEVGEGPGVRRLGHRHAGETRIVVLAAPPHVELGVQHGDLPNLEPRGGWVRTAPHHDVRTARSCCHPLVWCAASCGARLPHCVDGAGEPAVTISFGALVRRWGGRAVGLALTGIGLYVVAPSLLTHVRVVAAAARRRAVVVRDPGRAGRLQRWRPCGG